MIALALPVNGQGRRSIDARITGWTVSIDYSDIDNLRPGSNPVTRVRLSHPSIDLKASMEVPFESFFALWEHLDSLSDAEPVRTPVDLPVGKDGAVLAEKDDVRQEYKIVTSDEAVLLVRFWLDTFKHRWVEGHSALPADQSQNRGGFGYLLRHNAFPAKGNTLAKLTEEQKKPNTAEMAKPRKPSD